MDKKTISKKFIDLLEIVEKLRGPDGCPWDQEQTHETLLPYFLEEAYEVMAVSYTHLTLPTSDLV